MPTLTERPDAPLVHADEKEHRRRIAVRANASLARDGSNSATNPIVLESYTVATLPTASDWESGLIYVSDETGGATLAFSDGINWRRVQDLAVVS